MTTHTDICVLCFGVDVWKNLDDEYITIKQFLPRLVSFQMDGQLSRGFEPRLPPTPPHKVTSYTHTNT